MISQNADFYEFEEKSKSFSISHASMSKLRALDLGVPAALLFCMLVLSITKTALSGNNGNDSYSKSYNVCASTYICTVIARLRLTLITNPNSICLYYKTILANHLQS